MEKKKFNYNTLFKKDRPLLYQFLCWYSIMSDIHKDKELNALYPPNFTKHIVNNIFERKELNVKSKEELNNELKGNTSTFVFYVSSNTKCIDFLRHLRNSIAHDNLLYDNKTKKFILHDYDSKHNFTAFGKIEHSKLMSLFNYIFCKSKQMFNG